MIDRSDVNRSDDIGVRVPQRPIGSVAGISVFEAKRQRPAQAGRKGGRKSTRQFFRVVG